MLHLRACRFFATPNIEILIIILRSFRRIQARQNRLNSCLLLEEETKTVEIPHRSILRIFDRRNSSKDQIPIYHTISIFFFFLNIFHTIHKRNVNNDSPVQKYFLFSVFILLFAQEKEYFEKMRRIKFLFRIPFRVSSWERVNRDFTLDLPPPPVPPDHLTRSISFFFSFFDLIIRDRGQPRIHPEREKD